MPSSGVGGPLPVPLLQLLRIALLTLLPDKGEEIAWILRPGKVVTDTEFEILADSANVESLVRAAQESARGDDTLELT
jgi:hypothetical protein